MLTKTIITHLLKPTKLSRAHTFYFTKLTMNSDKSIAVVGGGISSLSMLLNMAQNIDCKECTVKVKVFERKYKLGGRITAQQSPEDEQHHGYCADMGANYIDYQNEQQKKFVQSHLPKNLLHNFKPFTGKLMIYENKQLKQAQMEKTRYYYESGFNHMASDWKKQIQAEKTLNISVGSKNEVEKVIMEKGKWRVKQCGEKKQMEGELFDVLIFGTPAPETKKILQRSSLDQSKELICELDKIKYTQQISAIFELDQGMLKSKDSPYSILFKDHQLTFICFHQQKYPTNEKNIAVIQTSEEFTQKYAKKLGIQGGKDVQLNHNQIQKEISEEIWKLIPQEIRDRFKLTQKCLGVHYWPRSLVKPSTYVEGKEVMFDRLNHELNKNFKNEKGQRNLYFTGDYLNNKSRVTGAMAVGIKLSQQIMKEHCNIDVTKKMSE